MARSPKKIETPARRTPSSNMIGTQVGEGTAFRLPTLMR